MKTPTNIGGNSLITWLQTATEIRMADLYTITLKSGVILRYTTWDSSLTLQANVFLTGPPHIKRSSIEEKLGLDVSSLELEVSAGLSDTVNGVPVLQLIANGAFDGALLRIDRLFMDSAGNQIGTVLRFSGIIGAIDEVGRTSAKLTADALVSRLSQPLPNIILQPNCTNTLYDARCTLAKSNLLSFSEQFDNPAWGKTNAAVTSNAVVDPLGGQTADAVTFSGGVPGNAFLFQQTTPQLAAGIKFTFSCWVKAASGSPAINLMVEDKFAVRIAVDVPFTLNQTWQRFSVSMTAAADSTGITPFIYNATDQANTYHLWGAQLELGPIPTAYTPTTAAAALAEWNNVQSGSTVNKLISASSRPDGYYDNGQIVFISGANNGIVKAVKSYLGQQFFFNSPLPFVPSAGDAFIAYPGCDKTQATCAAKFNNLANFEGFPYVPAPETAI